MGELVSHKPLADKESADKKTKITLIKSIAFLVVSIWYPFFLDFTGAAWCDSSVPKHYRSQENNSILSVFITHVKQNKKNTNK